LMLMGFFLKLGTYSEDILKTLSQPFKINRHLLVWDEGVSSLGGNTK
jgi:hypothetical protein